MRLAIGSFGLTPENSDAVLADLLATKLSTAPGLDLVERRESDKILSETALTVAGLAHPKDTIHVGTLLHVDQFVLGTTVAINGTNYHFVRLVDARSGAMRAINAFPDASLDTLAENIASFVIGELQHLAQAKRDYLAIGVIQNLGVNNRFSDFPAQMRDSLAAKLNGKVTILERDVISYLANEVRMSLAGLTEAENGTNSQIQFAFWIVDGFYQSYEVAKPQVQLKVKVERLQGGSQSFMLQSEPNAQFFAKIAQTVEAALKKLPLADTNAATRHGEPAAHGTLRWQLIDYRTSTNPSQTMNTHLAIGSLGLAMQKADGDLADLVIRKLSPAEFHPVQTGESNKAISETNSSLADLANPKDVIRLGASLGVNQLILGETVSINGTNYHIVRLLDARSGAIRAINAYPDASLETLAAEIAGFVSAEVKSRAPGKRNFVAMVIQSNGGSGDCNSNLPAQMGASIARNLSGKVTFVERDILPFLANEVQTNVAGLTDPAEAANLQKQFGYWIADASYYCLDGFHPWEHVDKGSLEKLARVAPEIMIPKHFKVRLDLHVGWFRGYAQSFKFQDEPNEQLFAKLSQTIEAALKQKPLVGKQAEIAALEQRGGELVDYRRLPDVLTRQVDPRSSANPAQATNTVNEAIRVYESILLLDPDNVAAKMRLAACLLYYGGPGRFDEVWPAERLARVANLYKEVISSRSPEYSVDAQVSLAFLHWGPDGVKMLRQSANETLDPKAKESLRFYAYLDMLRGMILTMPFEKVLPDLRDRIFDDLADVEKRTNQPFIVSFDGAWSGDLVSPQFRNQAVNAILPDVLEKFPNLKPQILLAAVCEQTDTNSPVIAQFLESLKQCGEHPETVLQPSSYFTHLSTTLEEEKLPSGQAYHRVCERTFERGHYSTVIAMAQARQRASEKGLAQPLTDHGKRLMADSYRALGQWQKALDTYTALTNVPPAIVNECRTHLGMALISEAVPESAWKNETDMNKVKIAYSCIGRKDWLTAAAILDSIGHRTIRMQGGGPWWTSPFVPVLPALRANECRAHAGKPLIKDPMVFELGDTPYVGFSRGASRFDFQIEGEDMWVGIFNRIERFSGPGPINSMQPVEKHDVERVVLSQSSGICVTPQFIWLGTVADGLFEFNRKIGQVSHFTMKDGLLLDGISGLCLQSNLLWIAYRQNDGGGVGTLDLQTHKFAARTPGLHPEAGTRSEPNYLQRRLDRTDQAPQMPVSCMAAGAPGEMWFGVNEKGIQCYHEQDERWTTYSEFPFPFYFTSVAADTAHDRMLITSHARPLDNEKSIYGGLDFYNYRDGNRQWFRVSEGLPATETTSVAVDGNIAWVGGRGFVAVIDIVKRKVLRIAYISANNITKIQLGKRYAWVQVYANPMATSNMYQPGDAGEATTGIYRVERASIEQPMQITASRLN